MTWATRILAPWLSSGFVMGATVWGVVNVTPWLALPGALAAAWLAVVLFPQDNHQ
jgi:hypothetical protein